MKDKNSLYQTAAAVRLSPVCVKTESELPVKIICDGSAAADRLSPEPTPNNSASEDLGINKQHDPISTYDLETEDRDITSEKQDDVISERNQRSEVIENISEQVQEGKCHKCQVYSEEKEEESSNCTVAAVPLSPVLILEKDEENRSLLKPSDEQRQLKESILRERERPPRKPPDNNKNSGQDKEGKRLEVLVRKFVGMNLIVPIQVNGIDTWAVVDSAAQVTIISQKLRDQITDSLEIVDKVNLRGIGNHDKGLISAQKTKGINIKFGKNTYPWEAYVAEMTDPVLLGLDFLVSKKCILDLERNEILLPHETIFATLKRNFDGEECTIYKVIASKKLVVPPNNKCLVPIEISFPIESSQEYLVEPKLELNGLIASCSITLQKGYINVINATNHSVVIKYHQPLGTATKFEEEVTDEIIPEDINKHKESSISSVADIRSVSMKENKELVINSAERLIKPMPETRSQIEEMSFLMPEYLKGLFDAIKGPPESHVLAVGELLLEFKDIFAQHDLDLGCLAVIKHRIETGDAKPVKQRMRRTPLGFENEELKHLDKMLAAGVIQYSESDWASAPVLIRKKDGTVRWCIDYRALNEKTVKDQYPLPLIEDCLDTLSGTLYFSTLDLASGYYQIELEKESMKKTAFITKYGLFEHNRMGFGLCNAPATFQRAMNLVLRGLTWTEVLVYIDDVIVLGATFEDHISSLRKVFERMRTYNLKLKSKKCQLLKTEVVFLGRQVSRSGISITSSKADAIQNWPEPTNRKELESFLGYVNYHHSHIQGYAGITSNLYEMAKSKQPFEWHTEHQKTFKQLKEILSSAPCLAFPIPTRKFILDCDASYCSIGAELIQVQNGEERTIPYASLSLLPRQRRYCTTRKELLAVVRFCRYFRHYLLGRPFIVRTDHNSLAWLMRFKLIEGQLARWLEELAQYDLQILHRSGNKHSNADGLSRIPDTLQPCDCYNAGIKVEELPCGGCRYCQRAHQQWARFEEDVDDVVPLAIKGSALVSNCKTDSGTRLTRLSNESEFTILPTVSLATLFETDVENRPSRLPKVLETEVLEADQSRKETDQEDVPCDEKR